MTNEELAERIRAGESELSETLWRQVEAFVTDMARRRLRLTGGAGGVELEDLVQSGYIAMTEALEDYRPELGYAFLTYLGRRLRNAFNAASGCRSSRRDPLNGALSLEALREEDGELSPSLPADPGDAIARAEQRIWLGQLRETEERALAALPESQSELLQRRYFQGLSLRELGLERGICPEAVRQRERRALAALRRGAKSSGLEQFVEERTPYYARVGPSAFNTAHTSAVELAVLRRETLRERGE